MACMLSIMPFYYSKNDQGETTAVIFHPGQGIPDNEGKKLKNE